MSKLSLKEVSKKMSKLDLCMMTTITKNGMSASRPMSNNGDSKYNGTSYFFTSEDSHLVKDLKKNANVNLAFTDSKKLFLSVEGKVKLVRDQSKMKDHWVKDLDVWFEDGIETPGLVMLEVKAKRIKYWQGEDEGELIL